MFGPSDNQNSSRCRVWRIAWPPEMRVRPKPWEMRVRENPLARNAATLSIRFGQTPLMFVPGFDSDSFSSGLILHSLEKLLISRGFGNLFWNGRIPEEKGEGTSRILVAK